MTVKELIAALKEMPQDRRVYLGHYDGGCVNHHPVEKVSIGTPIVDLDDPDFENRVEILSWT